MRVYAGERDPESGVGRVWVLHEPPRPDLAEVVEIIAELRSLSSVPLDETDDRDRAKVFPQRQQCVAVLEQHHRLAGHLACECLVRGLVEHTERRTGPLHFRRCIEHAELHAREKQTRE